MERKCTLSILTISTELFAALDKNTHDEDQDNVGDKIDNCLGRRNGGQFDLDLDGPADSI
jgi:hypothetical protein